MAYFTLAIKSADHHNVWAPQFGDYDREVVVQERKDTYSEFKNAEVKIIKTATSSQRLINEAISNLNGGTYHTITAKDGKPTLCFVPNK